MSLTFADTHNMVAYLKKSDASEGFNQIIDFLNGSYIKHDLIINPYIYVSCIKQFWNTVVVKQSNDVTRLQAIVDKKKVVITEATIKDALRLDDAEGVDCLPNEEIFTELARIGQKFNFSQYIFESLVRNVDSSSKIYMYPRVGKGFLGVETPLFEGMLVAGEFEEQGDAEEHDQDDEALDACAALARRVEHLKTSQRIESSDDTNIEDASNQGRMIDELDRDEGVALMDDEGAEKKAEEA
uniref:Putative ribonuclease H-like domain-containing protein n=1 Tax=Tanacetum cinerariifolium TaxID=118510 RepID=A0A6L2JRQ0_TANCI|nr:putative ribonuclease H-like domain-containing protein [Tanacetum cinerariifolium]